MGRLPDAAVPGGRARIGVDQRVRHRALRCQGFHRRLRSLSRMGRARGFSASAGAHVAEGPRRAGRGEAAPDRIALAGDHHAEAAKRRLLRHRVDELGVPRGPGLAQHLRLPDACAAAFGVRQQPLVEERDVSGAGNAAAAGAADGAVLRAVRVGEKRVFSASGSIPGSSLIAVQDTATPARNRSRSMARRCRSGEQRLAARAGQDRVQRLAVGAG